jgi:photosynthetic reaction center cytochrome c subunit
VAETGVTCYTCHRGNNIPQNVWFTPVEQKRAKSLLGDRAGQNAPAKSVALAALPNDPFTPYLSQAQEIRVAGAGPLPTGKGSSIQQTEQTYGLMTHMSDALGVNCTYCHNSRSFGDWSTSSPARVTAWHAIRMVRELNGQFLDPLKTVFPPNRLGPNGDVAKADCTTCHQGVFKPLYGAKMLASHMALASKSGQDATPATGAAKVAKANGDTPMK